MTYLAPGAAASPSDKAQPKSHNTWRVCMATVVGLAAAGSVSIVKIQNAPVRLSEVPSTGGTHCNAWAHGKRQGNLLGSTLKATNAIMSGEQPATPQEIKAKCEKRPAP